MNPYFPFLFFCVCQIKPNLQKTGNAIRAIGKMKNLTLSAASRKSAGGINSNPRPSLSGSISANNSNSNNNHTSLSFASDSRITCVDEEVEPLPNDLLSTNDKSTKDPRVCNERSDSGFSECSNCSTPSASCVCHHNTAQLQDTIVEEKSNSTCSGSSIEPHETITADNTHAAEEIHTDHDIQSEISSLEYDDVNKINCDNNDDIIDISIRVPTRRELLQNEDGEMMSEIERRKVSLENTVVGRKTSPLRMREEFSLEKLKKTNKVTKLMEKFEIPSDEPSAIPNAKFKSSVTIEKGLKSITNTNPTQPAFVMPVNNSNSVKMCDLPKHDSINARHANNHSIHSPDSSPTAKTPLSSSSATRKSPSPSSSSTTTTTNPSTTFRLSDRVREATERLSKPKQQAMTTDKTTKASILKQNSNFVRSKEFWKR